MKKNSSKVVKKIKREPIEPVITVVEIGNISIQEDLRLLKALEAAMIYNPFLYF